MSNAAELTDCLDGLYPGRTALLLIPLCTPKPHKHGGDPCEHRGKVPIEREWNAKAIKRAGNNTDRDKHLAKLGSHLARGGNIGLVIPPGALVLDGDDARATAYLDCALPDAPLQATARGGHFAVAVPAGLDIRNAAKIRLTEEVSVDLRSAEKGQIVVEPSIHESGAPYTSKRPLPSNFSVLPECPPGLLDRILKEVGASSSSNETRSTEPRVICEGERDDTLFRLGCAMRRRDASFETIARALLEENAQCCHPPPHRGQGAKDRAKHHALRRDFHGRAKPVGSVRDPQRPLRFREEYEGRTRRCTAMQFHGAYYPRSGSG